LAGDSRQQLRSANPIVYVGALLSDNAAYVRTARFLATQARDDAPHYEHSRIGHNYRMSNILAAIGRGQMEALPSFVQKRREINRRYRKRLSPMQAISFLTEPNERYRSNFWLTTILIDSNAAGTDRETIRHALEAENIESRPLWKPMHMQPVYKQMNAPMYGGAVCERLFNDGLCLPSGTSMTKMDIERVCRIVTKCMDPHRALC
jgi:dTDP-4-amino-4,6-dideoxygalactose transaminase